MTPSKLFFKRLTVDWKYKYSVWKTTIDWTVALYIVLPALVLGIDRYLQWWKISPLWLNLLPKEFFFIICYLFAWSSSLRIFWEEGDQIFLLNQKKWLQQIMKYGLMYSFSLYFLFSILFFGLLAPFLLQYYQFSYPNFVSLFLITFILKIFFGLVKQLLTLRYYGWRQFVFFKGILVLSSILFISVISNVLSNSIVSSVTLLFLLIVLSRLMVIRLNFTRNFLADVAREQSQRLKYVSLLLGFSGTAIKKPKKQRIYPWLFRHSNLIFQERTPINGLVELGIKATLRNRQGIWQYIQFVMICLLVVLSISGSLKWLIWLGLAFVMVNFSGLYWKEIMASEFVRLFQWKPDDQALALRKFLFLMTLPGFMLISIIMGFQTFSWLGAFEIVPISIILVFYTCRIVSFHFF